MKRLWNPLWKIAAIVAVVVAIPTAALAATGAFTSGTATPAVTGTNSSAAANAAGVKGTNTGGGLNTRYGVTGSANGPAGIGVSGTGTKYGVFSNGPLGIAAGKTLSCTGCVTGANLANRLSLTYNLEADATSAPITIQPNRPVQLIGANTTAGWRGVASATLLRAPASFIEWNAVESPGTPALVSGFSGTAGTHIVFIDFGRKVDIQVGGTDTIVIHNANTFPQTGVVTLTW